MLKQQYTQYISTSGDIDIHFRNILFTVSIEVKIRFVVYN